LDECKAELAAERVRAVAPEPVAIEPSQPNRHVQQAKAEAEPKPVKWWAKGSKWDKDED
jgi:hypothetical protein